MFRFDPESPELQGNPSPVYPELRDNHPVYLPRKMVQVLPSATACWPSPLLVRVGGRTLNLGFGIFA